MHQTGGFSCPTGASAPPNNVVQAQKGKSKRAKGSPNLMKDEVMGSFPEMQAQTTQGKEN